MKNYKEVAESVFRRSKEVEAENKLRRRRITEIGVSAACWAAAGAVGFGIWKTNIAGKDIVTSQPTVGAGSAVRGGVTIPTNDRDNSADKESSKPAIYPPLNEKDVDPRCCVPIHLPVQCMEEFSVYSYDVEEEKYKAPENGEVFLTKALKAAMSDYEKNYNDIETCYDIVIEYYKDGKRVDPTKELYESEVGKFGDSCYFLTDGRENAKHYICATAASYDMIEDLVPNKEYGYVIFLHGNFFKDTDTESYDRFYSSSITREPEIEKNTDSYKPDPIKGHIANIDTEYEEKEYSPENGAFVAGESLKAALEKYGREDKNGEIYYKVLIEFYKDGEKVETTKELYESLDRYNLASSSEDWGNHFTHYIWTHMTVEEIENFESSCGYGCALHLYDAYLGYPFELTSNIINGYYNNGVYIE